MKIKINLPEEKSLNTVPVRVRKAVEYHNIKQGLYEKYGEERIDKILEHSSFGESVEGLRDLEEELEYLLDKAVSESITRKQA